MGLPVLFRSRLLSLAPSLPSLSWCFRTRKAPLRLYYCCPSPYQGGQQDGHISGPLGYLLAADLRNRQDSRTATSLAPRDHDELLCSSRPSTAVQPFPVLWVPLGCCVAPASLMLEKRESQGPRRIYIYTRELAVNYRDPSSIIHLKI